MNLRAWTLVLIAACAPAPEAAEAPARVEIHADGSRTVHLPGAQALSLEGAPQGILATSASATDIALDLLPPERLVGLTELSLQYSQLAQGPLPEALGDLPLLGPFQTEVVLDLGPDLVLTHVWQDPVGLEALARAGIPSIALPIAGEWEDLLGQIDLVARVLDVEARGAELIASLEARRQALAEAAPAARRVLSISSYGDALWTGGRDTTYDLMIRLAGQRNAAAEAGLTGNLQIQLEELLELDPDVFLTGLGAGATGQDYLREHPLLKELEAVREDRFVILPSHLFSTTSHELLAAAEALAEALKEL